MSNLSQDFDLVMNFLNDTYLYNDKIDKSYAFTVELHSMSGFYELVVVIYSKLMTSSNISLICEFPLILSLAMLTEAYVPVANLVEQLSLGVHVRII